MTRKATAVLAAVAAAHAAAQTKGLYGMGNAGQWYVLQFIAADGSATNVSQSINEEFAAQQLSDVDQARGVYYYVGYNLPAKRSELVGLSLKDGSIASRVPLP